MPTDDGGPQPTRQAPPMPGPKAKRFSLKRFALLLFLAFYLVSYGPAVYLFKAADADQAWPVTLPPFALFYLPHFLLHQHTEIYYTYCQRWMQLAEPDKQLTSWEELQARRAELRAMAAPPVSHRYASEIVGTSGAPIAGARVTVRYASYERVYATTGTGAVAYEITPSVTVHHVEVTSDGAGSTIFFSAPIAARVVLDRTTWQQRAKRASEQ